MSEPNAVAPCQNEKNKYPPGCWRLWRGPQRWWDWGTRLRHWKDVALAEVTAGPVRVYTGSSWKVLTLLSGKTHAQGSYLRPPVPPTYQILPSTVSAEEAPRQRERSAGVHLPACRERLFPGDAVGAEGEKRRAPRAHQVSVERALASSRDFLCHWRNAINSSHHLDFICVRIKLTIPQRCPFLSFIGKVE